MRLAYVEACGFRGFRDKIRIEFGTGFTVISGRNGVGKSTLCDAVEFAITGTISKYRVEKSGQESLSDYLWWRGAGSPASRYVTVAFADENQEQFTITRTRETGCDRSVKDMEYALCSDSRPVDALRQLCKTSIIRDESISALSVDLSETERFEFVQSALGTVEGSDFGSKAKKVLDSAKAAHESSERAYDSVHAQLATCLSELSEVRQAITRSGDLKAATELVEQSLTGTINEKVDLLSAGREALLAHRNRFANLREAVLQCQELLELRQASQTPEEKQRRQSARLSLERASGAKSAAEGVIAQLEKGLAQEEAADVVASSLAILVDHGQRLGLHNGEHCPLCAADRTIKEFEAGLETARSRVDALAASIATTRHKLSEARTSAERTLADYADAMDTWEEIERKEKDLAAREQVLVELPEQLGLDSGHALDPVALHAEAAAEHEHLIELERAVLALEGSRAVSATLDLQARIEMLRKDVQNSSQAMDRCQEAIAAARTIDRAVKRVNAEIVHERLAQIIPLLDELYQRLRPHPDWRTMGYRIRGEVRRFLSLTVGDNLNPQFVLSSGQRRAVGLSFLLSVHLARAWVRWRTLLLDDPVQHIDDFRALHVVEILSALRLDDRQIVCTVEDESLADLLCRRLSTNTQHTGLHYVLEISGEGVAKVGSETVVPPPPVGVLRSWSGVPAVGLDA